MAYAPINLKQKLTRFSEQWSPRIVAQMNDTHFKLVKFQGDFVWHKHESSDEVFLVLDGGMRIDFRDGAVELTEGEMFVVSRGTEHKPLAESECHVLVIEREGTQNTGNAGGEKTAADNVWI
jgi:mannose-6-phosphate isomerase-like protein (cupin superfamily)